MSAAKIPSIREHMRRQEILTRELGGASVDISRRWSAVGKAMPERKQVRPAIRGKTAIRNAGSVNQSSSGRDRASRRSLPGFASLIRKVIAY